MATVTREQMLEQALRALWDETCASGNGQSSDFGWPRARRLTRAALASPPAEDAGWTRWLGPDETPLQRMEREFRDCQAVTGLLAEARAEIERLKAQAPPASDQPGPTVINEDDGDVTIDFDYANDRVVSIRLGEESSGLSAFVDGESHALCPLDRVPPKVLALLRTEAKAVTLRQSDPPGLVANWRPIETAPKRTDVLAGWADRPHWLPQVLQQDDAGMWFSGEESDYRPPTHWMPLPASPQAETKGDE